MDSHAHEKRKCLIRIEMLETINFDELDEQIRRFVDNKLAEKAEEAISLL
jgi:hypothetical protein